MNHRFFFAAVALAGAMAAHAQSAEDKGLAIAQEAEQRGEGYGDSQATMTMVLRNRNGDEAIRSLRSQTLEVADDGDKSLIVFDEPRDVAGTALLTHAHSDSDDDRWLYLPALRRVKRIASSGQTGAFMGSEFAYEDLGSQEIEKYRFKWLRDETVDGVDMHVLERIPKDENSGYSRQVVWMDQAELRLQKVVFYDRKGEHLKTLTATGYAQFLDRYWRPLRLDMVNHVTGKSTTLTFEDYVFDNGFLDRDFDENSLANVR
ncbi:outer membrane lipoprotein-sorting protein [Flagellatimonas centrodinii]|uniref:outer membrane lipoprotein-sorting protein n=1 Tax=Flagellatimonas centrodinii TaxID=2806210 RepID=UPI001FF03A76|nr:outer membrane lipoprotein-sorting protein [Flagellatimonas centrodinii]